MNVTLMSEQEEKAISSRAENVNERKTLNLNLGALFLVNFLVFAAFTFVFYLESNYAVAGITGSLLLFQSGILLFLMGKKYRNYALHISIVNNFLFFFYLNLASPSNHYLFYTWIGIVPILAFCFIGSRVAYIWTGLTVLSWLFVFFLPDSFMENWIYSLEMSATYELFFHLLFVTFVVLIIFLALKGESQEMQLMEDNLRKFKRENNYLRKQFHIIDNRNYRLVKLYQNLKKYGETSEQKTELITEAAIVLNSKNQKIQSVVNKFVVQSKKLEEINEDLTNSIRYAQRIQAAMTPDQEFVKEQFRDAFIFFQPRDIVSGDFYWYGEKKYMEGTMKILIAADCTGHGVPGAFMTIVGNSLINEIVNEMQILEPDVLLNELDRKLITTLSSRNGKAIHDGMDMVVLMIDEEKQLINYAAAHNPIYYVRNQELHQIKGSKFAVGSSQYKTKKVFKSHKIQVEPGDIFYIFTDGFQDQFGKDQRRKYMVRRFRNFLLSINRLPLGLQGQKVASEFKHWKQDLPQTDDVLVIGFRL